MKRPTIDWQLFGAALQHYRDRGYAYLEVPWIVSDVALHVTLPTDKTGLMTQDGPLAGSAEQSFIHMMLAGELTPGRYCAITPCFRDDAPDKLHQRSFMKLELIEFYRMPESDLNERAWHVTRDALDFMDHAICGKGVRVVTTEAGFDLELNGVEVGSYGHRSLGDRFHWVYGTGLAEPRFSIARGLT